MTRISNTYALKWQFKEQPNYKISKCRSIINTKTNRIIKKTLNGGSIGYWIAGKFTLLKNINSMVENIPKAQCPF